MSPKIKVPGVDNDTLKLRDITHTLTTVRTHPNDLLDEQHMDYEAQRLHNWLVDHVSHSMYKRFIIYAIEYARKCSFAESLYREYTLPSGRTIIVDL